MAAILKELSVLSLVSSHWNLQFAEPAKAGIGACHKVTVRRGPSCHKEII